MYFVFCFKMFYDGLWKWPLIMYFHTQVGWRLSCVDTYLKESRGTSPLCLATEVVQIPVTSEILGLMLTKRGTVTESQKANGVLEATEATEEYSHQFHSCFFCYYFPFTEILFIFLKQFIFYLVMMYFCYE